MKIAYLGGYFSPEHSMWQSFKANGVKIIFYISNDQRYYNNIYKQHHLNFKNTGHVVFIPDGRLENHLRKTKPDMVIHRYYKKKPVMFKKSKYICDKLKIPWVKYAQETNYDDDVKSHINSGQKTLLYAHNTNEYLKNLTPQSFFYTYGVSPAEKKTNTTQDRDMGCIGRHMWNKSEYRQNSLHFFLSALDGIPMHAYGDNWDTVPGVIAHPKYNLEQATQIINKHKIILNVESTPTLEGAYTYKMFQAMGCGAVVITAYKKSIEELFGKSGENLIMVKTIEETKEWINKLLKNNKMRNKIGENSYKYIHQHFDWFERFKKIYKTIHNA